MDDLISREATPVDILTPKIESMTPKQFYRFIMEVCGTYLRQDAAPVAHGRWIRQKGHNPEAICSRCGRDVVYQAISGRWAFEYFCPHCGARMDGGDGND